MDIKESGLNLEIKELRDQNNKLKKANYSLKRHNSLLKEKIAELI